MFTQISPRSKLFVLVSLLIVVSLVLGACDSQVVKDAKATATAMADNAQATQIVAQAQALLNGTPTNMPTPQFTPTAPVVSNLATPTTQAPVQTATPQLSAKDAHDQHLLVLDPTYRSYGWEAWLTAAGIQVDTSRVESRQPVEEVILGHTTVTALVIRATGMVVNWPACVTTDHPEQVSTSADTRQHQPDLRNASVMYTNVTLNGQGTVYADCSDWGQLNPPK